MREKKIMAICDTEGAYAYRLMEYMEERRSLPFEIHAFTSADRLCDFAAKQEVELLLISEEALADADTAMETPAARRVVLTSGECSVSEREIRICKYQSAQAILEQVMAFGHAEKGADPAKDPSTGCKLHGVYAPCGGSGSLLFSAALGQMLAAQTATLYINLRSYSALDRLGDEVYDRTLSDLLYYGRRSGADLTERFPGIVRPAGRMDFLPPAPSPADLQEINAKEWESLFGEVMREGSYGALVVEFSDAVRDLPEVLKSCHRLYVTETGDAVARAATDQFLEDLHRRGSAEPESRCVRICLPGMAVNAWDGDLKTAADGVMGGYVQKVLAERSIFAGGEEDGSAADVAQPADGLLRRKWRALRRRNTGAHR